VSRTSPRGALRTATARPYGWGSQGGSNPFASVRGAVRVPSASRVPLIGTYHARDVAVVQLSRVATAFTPGPARATRTRDGPGERSAAPSPTHNTEPELTAIPVQGMTAFPATT
jgi:hypothetical protein